MPTAFDVRALTSTIRIELDDSLSTDDQESIRSQWVDLIVESPASPAMTVRATFDETAPEAATAVERTIRATTAYDLADEITSEVTLTAINGLGGEALLLHAAAVALNDGRVIGFVGPSGRGKTTASAALGSLHHYVTDETLAIYPDCSVVPYPKPLSIGQRPGRKQHSSASGLGYRPAPRDGLHLAALVLLDRRPGIDRAYVESVTLIEAMSELVSQSNHLSRLEHPLRTLAEVAMSTGGVRRVVYSEAETLPAIVDDLLSAFSEEQPALMDVATTYRKDCDCFASPSETAVDANPIAEALPGTYRRTITTDALFVDDHLLVLTPGRFTVLDGVGPVVWLAADDDSTEEELREAALRQLPEPPEGTDVANVVSAVIEQLVDAGLLARR